VTDLNDWEPRELGVEFSPSLKRWRYSHTKELISTDVPVVALSRYNLSFCEDQRRVYLVDVPMTSYTQSERYRKCVEFLDHRIACLKAQALISQ